MLTGYRIVMRDECGHESHINEPYTRREHAEADMRKLRDLHGPDWECSVWIEHFDYRPPEEGGPDWDAQEAYDNEWR